MFLFMFYHNLFSADDVTKAMTEVCLNILEDDIQLREEAYKAMETIMKDAGAFPTEIREYLDGASIPEEWNRSQIGVELIL